MLNEPTSSTLASLYSTCILVFTLLSVVVFVVSTDRSYLAAPSTCDTPVCANDPNICPNTIICEPLPINSLRDIEYACLLAFVIDYFMRLAFVPIIHPRLCGVIEDNTDIIDDLEEDQIHREQYVMLETGTHIDMEYKNVNWLKKFVIFIIKPMNLIDFVAIIPWFLSFTAIDSTSVTIVRVLRLGRILRILRVGKDSEWLIIMVLSVYRSLPALGSLLFFSAFSNVIFGCIIFFFEQGTFQVDGTHYPDGWYMRVDLLGNLERSPFESIPLSIYYSVVSSTTVGYGDMTTTSEGGRFFSICCMYCGVMTLALPIAVIGNNFASLYDFFRGKVGIKLSKLFLINWIHSPHDTRKLIKQKVQDKFHHKGHDKFNPTTDDAILADPRIEDLILVHELVSKLSSLYVIGLSCTGPYFELLEDSLMYMNLLEGTIISLKISLKLLLISLLGLELLTTNFSGCDPEEVFQAFSDYLDKLVGCNKFARSHMGSFATFGSVDDYEKNNSNNKLDKKRVLDELISAKDTKFSRDADTLNTGRAKNSIHRSIAKIFIDALEREVSDTVAKVEDLSASIIRDNDELIVDVYKYPFIENKRSVHHKTNNWNEYWHSCISEMFFFCKGKRNLIF